MSTGSKKRAARVRRERAQSYRVRQELHATQIRRRRRDNLVAGFAGGLVLVGLLAVQLVLFAGGPSPAEPMPTPTPSESTVTPAPTPTPTDATPTPTP